MSVYCPKCVSFHDTIACGDDPLSCPRCVELESKIQELETSIKGMRQSVQSYEMQIRGYADMSATNENLNPLLGTIWKHKRKGGLYRVTELDTKREVVYLHAESKGCRSTWKAKCLLPFDYEQVISDKVSSGAKNLT